jgi:hypothetical protein
MANVTMPTPVALAGGALCLLGGYLVGVVAGPDTEDTDTATVVSYDADSDRLCLTGEAVAAEAEAPESAEGELCGQWRRIDGGPDPREGDQFRFATLSSDPGDAGDVTTLIYGDVVR